MTATDLSVDLPAATRTARAAASAGDVPRTVPARITLPAGAVRATGAAIRSDARRWWLHRTRPPQAQVWVRAWRLSTTRVPEGAWPVKAAWTVDHWTFGLALFAVGFALSLLLGGAWWLACHPVRRWVALLLTIAVTALVAVLGAM